MKYAHFPYGKPVTDAALRTFKHGKAKKHGGARSRSDEIRMEATLRRLALVRKGWHLQTLAETSVKTLRELDGLLKECTDARSLVWLRTQEPWNHILFHDSDFVVRITVYKKRQTAYLSDVCASAAARGRGLFRAALDFIGQSRYALGINSITLDASTETKGGLTQAERIRVFQKSGFTISKYADTWPGGLYRRVRVRPITVDGSVVQCLSTIGPIACPMILKL